MALDPSLLDYFHVVRRRRWVFLAALASSLLGTALFTFRQIPRYRASTTLIVQADTAEIARFSGNNRRALSRDFYETQYGIIRSQSVLEKVFERAKLGSDPAFSGRDDPIDAFRRRVVVEPVPSSGLVRIAVDHEDRATAVRVADLLAAVYIEHNSEDRRAASQEAFSWLSAQIEKTRAQVETSERALLEVATPEQDVVSVERRQGLVEEELARLNQQHSELVNKNLELKTILGELEHVRANPALVEALPQMLENTLVRNLRSELNTLAVELARVSQKYKEKHPAREAVESQIASLKQRLAAEVATIYSAVEIEYRISKAKERAAETSLESAKLASNALAEQAIRHRTLEREAESSRKIYDVLLQRLREADVSESSGGMNIRVLDTARTSSEPHSPRPLLNLTLAAFAGLILGVGLCFLLENIDSSLKDEEDVRRGLGEPVLGLVPRMHGPLRVAQGRRDELSGAYAAIATALRLYAQDHVLGALVVTSAVPEEGKTVSAFCLASSFAEAGMKVLLIDTDMFQAALAKRMKIDQSVGLSAYFLQRASFDQIVRRSSHANLDVIPAGLIPPNPAAPLGQDSMRALVELARQRYDLVILDTPPVAVALDVAFLAQIVDGVVMVVRANSTSRRVVRRSLAQLHESSANILGVVLTMADARLPSSYYYYQYGSARAGRSVAADPVELGGS